MIYIFLFFFLSLPVSAGDKILANIPAEIQTAFTKELPGSKFRIDGTMEYQNKIWIPIVPGESASVEEPSTTKLLYKTDTDVYFFSNSWVFIPIEENTIKGLDYYPEQIQEILLGAKIIPEFLVPENFELPRDLAMLSGRLPIKLRAVQLATDREVLYRERLSNKEEAKLEFFVHSISNGNLAKLSISADDDFIQKDITHLIKDISFLSKIKTVDDKTFLVDQNQAKIFYLKNKNKLDFDATKPGEKELETEFDLIEYFDLEDYGVEASLQDFVFTHDRSTLYVLTKNPNNLLVINLETKEQIKKIETPFSCSDLLIVSRSTSEPDKILFFSKASSEIFLLNTFDHRISQKISLNELSKTNSYIPRAMLVDNDNIYLAAELGSKINHSVGSTDSALVTLDIVTGAFKSEISLPFTPNWMNFSQDGNLIYLQGNQLKDSYLSKIEIKNMQILENLKLDPDFQDPWQLEATGYQVLLVPSSVSNQLGLLDTDSWLMMKKFDLGFKAQLIHKI